MKAIIEGFATILFIILFCAFAVTFSGGVIEANYGPLLSSCQTNWSKLDYIFPAYRLGCWINKRPN